MNTCTNCHYSATGPHLGLVCRRYPPTQQKGSVRVHRSPQASAGPYRADPPIAVDTHFPAVLPTDWCGDWYYERKEKKATL